MHDLIILDGYNVIYKIPALLSKLDESLEGARIALADLVFDWKARSRYKGKLCVVFDARGEGDEGDAYFAARGIRCIYANDADGRIIRLIKESGGHVRILVISADNRVRNHCKAFSASVEHPLYLVQRPKKKRETSFEKDIDEAMINSINSDLRKAWGI